MIKHRLILILVLLGSMGVSAQKKNTWLRRNWTNMVAHYNIYYHGEKKLNEQVQDLVLIHKDDFSKPIEVYPYSDEATATSLKPKMEEVLKKTSIIINKKSKSKWVDDAWLLAGKAHFFGGNLISADENFQFVNSQYADRPINYEAKLWILKTVVKDGKPADAEAIFKTFLRDEKFPVKLQAQLNAVAGDIYAKMGLYTEAQKYLLLALAGTKDKVLKYRINFLLAQLYILTKDYEKARDHFRIVSKMNAPYEFAFQSNIGIVKANNLAGKTDTRESRRNLKKMLKDDKNIDYYDQLYFELGNLDYEDKAYTKSISNYQKAIRKASKNPELATNAYLKIAKIYYESKNYKMAEKFFDSTSMFITDKHPEYEKIKLQQSILSTLISHLITIHSQDSLLALANLPKDKLESEIKRIVEAEKEAKKKSAKKAKESEVVTPVVQTMDTKSYAGTDQFIFDNQALLGREYNEFIKRWGNRKLTDNWRIASINKGIGNESDTSSREEEGNNNATAEKDAPEDLKKYYSNIPFSENDKALAYKKILDGHYEAGKIYQEKLKEYQEAISHFEEALKRFNPNIYEAEIYYCLTKCFESLKDKANSEKYQRLLSSKYPESPYLAVLSNLDSTKPKVIISNNKSEKQEVIQAYEKMYEAFEKGNYSLVKQIKQEVDSKYAGNAIQAKFDLLYAMAIGKTEGIAKYMELLKQIKENYPNTEIGEEASFILETLDNKNKVSKLDPKSIYKYNNKQVHYFAITVEEGQTDRLRTALSNYNAKYALDKGYKIKSYLVGSKDLLTVESFGNKNDAIEYYKTFALNFKEFAPTIAVDQKYFVISTDNFKALMREMDEKVYMDFFTKMYL